MHGQECAKVTTMFIRKNKIALLIKILQFIHIFNLTENNSKVHYYCIFLAKNNIAQCVLLYIKITFKGLNIWLLKVSGDVMIREQVNISVVRSFDPQWEWWSFLRLEEPLPLIRHDMSLFQFSDCLWCGMLNVWSQMTDEKMCEMEVFIVSTKRSWPFVITSWRCRRWSVIHIQNAKYN